MTRRLGAPGWPSVLRSGLAHRQARPPLKGGRLAPPQLQLLVGARPWPHVCTTHARPTRRESPARPPSSAAQLNTHARPTRPGLWRPRLTGPGRLLRAPFPPEDIRCTRYPLLAGRRAMLSALRAPLLLKSVLSETLAAKRDHISFVIGPFRPLLSPPSDPEPRGRSLLLGTLESVESAMSPRAELRSRVVNAARQHPRHLPSGTSRGTGIGWPTRLCTCGPWPPRAFTTPPLRAACARAHPLFLCFAASSSFTSSSSQYAGYWE
ncbi:PREDICTED: LOW QUALITY PROTEIN: putative uncharacterized protein UNQ6490/PRO21339-like [Chrysochloris asiatica]|uniref:Uncharacterized protein n=1 Tax=Chrysochloris asiatica TaxID=185453 RepID=A0A9B0WLI2_CHRAS|nr:PREDICTED: LOW QUALITY PROTEIN: putative uncharacterized protein UNQ6490/PRO21339-like [Chrysochloris asiatica]